MYSAFAKTVSLLGADAFVEVGTSRRAGRSAEVRWRFGGGSVFEGGFVAVGEMMVVVAQGSFRGMLGPV